MIVSPLSLKGKVYLPISKVTLENLRGDVIFINPQVKFKTKMIIITAYDSKDMLGRPQPTEILKHKGKSYIEVDPDLLSLVSADKSTPFEVRLEVRDRKLIYTALEDVDLPEKMEIAFSAMKKGRVTGNDFAKLFTKQGKFKGLGVFLE
ncbi:MAG: hypothetical protein QNL04_04435 [SAR324 cluster bacterium]|nr:hypothetical protein [SAR324 cluster bacterium]